MAKGDTRFPDYPLAPTGQSLPGAAPKSGGGGSRLASLTSGRKIGGSRLKRG